MSLVTLVSESNHPRFTSKRTSWGARAEKLDRDIVVFHGALPFLRDLVAYVESPDARGIFEQSRAVDPTTLAEYTDTKHRSSQRACLVGNASPDLAFFNMACESVEGALISAYRALANPHAVVSRGSGYELLRYREGEFFREHVDAVKDHPTLGHRRLAVVAFANDDYAGGRLHFPRQGVTVEPEAGALVMFPATFTHPHESTPVTRGTKYSVVTWYY